MAPPTTVTVGPVAAGVTNAIVTSVTPTSGTTLVLNGSLVTSGVATMLVAQRVLATYGNEGSARTLRITGTNRDGNPIRETLTIPSGGAGSLYTTQDFKTVTGILPAGGGWTAALVVGTNGIASSPWVFVNYNFGPSNVSFAGSVSGTVTWQIDLIYTDPNTNQYLLGSQANGNYPSVPVVFTHPTLNGQMGNADGATTNPIVAWRAMIVSGTGTLTVTGIAAGITNI